MIADYNRLESFPIDSKNRLQPISNSRLDIPSPFLAVAFLAAAPAPTGIEWLRYLN